ASAGSLPPPAGVPIGSVGRRSAQLTSKPHRLAGSPRIRRASAGLAGSASSADMTATAFSTRAVLLGASLPSAIHGVSSRPTLIWPPRTTVSATMGNIIDPLPKANHTELAGRRFFMHIRVSGVAGADQVNPRQI